MTTQLPPTVMKKPPPSTSNSTSPILLPTTTTTTRNSSNNNNNNNVQNQQMMIPLRIKQQQKIYNDSYNAALQLDISILETLLQRNHSSQSRTKYYRYTNMVITKIKQYNISSLYMEWNKLYQQTLEPIQNQLKLYINNNHNNKKKQNDTMKRKRSIFDTTTTSCNSSDDDMHDIEQMIDTLIEFTKNPNDYTDCDNNNNANNNQDQQQQQPNMILIYNSTILLTDCIERLLYTSHSCFIEIIRGFFLPFQTILISCIARIYTLILYLQSTILLQFLQYIQDIYNITESLLSILLTSNNNDDENHNDNIIHKIRTLQIQIQYLQNNILTPILINIQQQLMIDANNQNNNTMSRVQRTESTLHSLGIDLRNSSSSSSSSSSSRKRNNNKGKNTICTKQHDEPKKHVLHEETTGILNYNSLNTNNTKDIHHHVKLDNNNNMTNNYRVRDVDINSTNMIDDDDVEEEEEDQKLPYLENNITTIKAMEHENDDIGVKEYVSLQHQSENEYDISSNHVTNQHTTEHITNKEDIFIDQNRFAVEQYKKQQQQQKTNKKRKQQQQNQQDIEISMKKTTNSKKKKKKQTDNFFDQLFG